jgi:hypothetical protein
MGATEERWVTEWRCTECGGTVRRDHAAIRFGLVVCATCVHRGIVSRLVAVRWEPLHTDTTHCCHTTTQSGYCFPSRSKADTIGTNKN